MNPINANNYESFYLDYLEGNLPQEQIKLLLQFLALHPDLCLDEELSLVQMEPSEVQLSDFEKMLLKKEPFISDLNESTLSYFSIAQLEGELTSEQSQKLEAWIKANPQFKSEHALTSQLKIEPNHQLVFEKKGALKQKESKIIALQLYWSAAAVAAGIVLVWTLNTEPKPSGSLVNNNTKNKPSDTLKYIPIQQNKESEKIAQSNEGINSEKNQLENKKGSRSLNNIIKPEEAASNFDKIEQLNRKSIASNQDANMMIYPRQFKLANQTTNTEPNSETENKDLAWVSISEMNNPVVPITNSLSNKLNREIDFRRVKPTDKKAGGFFLKIGKFEILHKGGK